MTLTDIEKTKLLVVALEQQGWSVFWDNSLLAGQDFYDEIEQEIGKARCMIVAWSIASRKSSWVKGEAILGERRKILVPIKFDSVEPPINFISLHTESLENWDGNINSDEFYKLQHAVARLVGAKSNKENLRNLNSTISRGGEQTFIEPNMITVPSGHFEMGSNVSSNEQPIHTVKIIKPFSLAQNLVTFDEYDLFVKANNQESPSDEGWGRAKRPVVNISWKDASAYANWLSKVSGKNYRLPSEAEWEYAASANSKSYYFFGDECEAQKFAWFDSNSGQKTQPVGEKQSNAFGLNDMLGNAWEWVEDCWQKNYHETTIDGSAWLNLNKSNTTQRVLRGGSFQEAHNTLRSTYRNGLLPFLRYSFISFRLVRD